MAKVLVVDDDKSVREVYRDTLLTGAEPHEVHVAANGASAREILADGDWDVVLADIIMPGEDGLELLRWIRLRNPSTRVILVTGSPDVDTASQARRLGAQEYLPKPVGCQALRQAVSQAGRVAALERASRRPQGEAGANPKSAAPEPQGYEGA